MFAFIKELLNHEALASLRGYLLLAREHYKKLSEREQWLIKIAGGVLVLWLAYDLIYQSFSERRAELAQAHQQAVEDYEWLNSQQERLSNLLVQRGVQRGGLDDIEATLKKHIKEVKVDYQPDNVVEVSWQGDSAEQFFKAINSLISRGAALNSLEFSRPNKERRTTFKAGLKL